MVTIVDGVQRSEFVPLDESWHPLEVKIKLPEGAQIGLDGRYLPFSREDGIPAYAQVHFNASGSYYEYRSSKTHEVLTGMMLRDDLPGWSTSETLVQWTVDQLQKGQFGYFRKIHSRYGQSVDKYPINDVADWEYRRADVLAVNKIGPQLKIGDIVRFKGQRDMKSARVIDTFDGENITSRKIVLRRGTTDKWELTGISSRNGILTVKEKLVDDKWQKIS